MNRFRACCISKHRGMPIIPVEVQIPERDWSWRCIQGKNCRRLTPRLLKHESWKICRLHQSNPVFISAPRVARILGLHRRRLPSGYYCACENGMQPHKFFTFLFCGAAWNGSESYVVEMRESLFRFWRKDQWTHLGLCAHEVWNAPYYE